MASPEPLSLEFERVLSREPAITVIRLETVVVSLCLDVDVLVHGRRWELCVLSSTSAVADYLQLQAWLGGNMVPIGPIMDPQRTLTERLTPVRMYADWAMPAGLYVICDELDHVTPATLRRWRDAHGLIVDELDSDGTVGVILLSRVAP